ncbi:hypothetical protein [Rahnella sp. ChDrAdgB13]|uniref:hypothetical protein n=1 Tax=Rahnella sp. ChDrAdgB13 TaxID=1850581 RepID=UPI001AD85525|nr:hypothetical protein [Rahnella sp. ChDrAdgB13]
MSSNAKPKSRNKDFVQTYRAGFDAFERLSDLKQNAAIKLYARLASLMDAQSGVVVIDPSVLIASLGFSKCSFHRAVKVLVEGNHIIRPETNVFAINPGEFWSGHGNSKPYSPFMLRGKSMTRRVSYVFSPESSNPQSAKVSVTLEPVIHDEKDKKPVGGTWGSETKPALEGDHDA